MDPYRKTATRPSDPPEPVAPSEPAWLRLYKRLPWVRPWDGMMPWRSSDDVFFTLMFLVVFPALALFVAFTIFVQVISYESPSQIVAKGVSTCRQQGLVYGCVYNPAIRITQCYCYPSSKP
jgi:hypothetical protein